MRELGAGGDRLPVSLDGDGTLLGKRYADEELGLELLCSKRRRRHPVDRRRRPPDQGRQAPPVLRLTNPAFWRWFTTPCVAEQRQNVPQSQPGPVGRSFTVGSTTSMWTCGHAGSPVSLLDLGGEREHARLGGQGGDPALHALALREGRPWMWRTFTSQPGWASGSITAYWSTWSQ